MSQACPYCGEELEGQPERCQHCGESLVDEPPQPTSKTPIFIVLGVVLACGLCLCLLVAAIAIPNLIEARKNGNETMAIGSLKTISTAQVLFREGDKDGDGVLDYGTLPELAGGPNSMGLIDSVLGSGTKGGYVFRCQPSSSDPEFQWMATADPAVPGTTGDRYFATNHEGVIYYSASAPIPLTADCQIPQDRNDVYPVGY